MRVWGVRVRCSSESEGWCAGVVQGEEDEGVSYSVEKVGEVT